MALKSYIDLIGLALFRNAILVASGITDNVYTLVAEGSTKNTNLQYYILDGTSYSPVDISTVPETIPANTYYTISRTSKSNTQNAPSIKAMTDYTDTYVDGIIENIVGPRIDTKVSRVNYGTTTISGASFTGIYTTNGQTHPVVAVDSTSGGTASSNSLITSGAVNSGLSNKADKATTLSGYGITDAKIESGTITLGSNTITPITEHQSLSAYRTAADQDVIDSGKVDKVEGKGLSTEDYSTAEKTKLSNIEDATQEEVRDIFFTNHDTVTSVGGVFTLNDTVEEGEYTIVKGVQG